MTLFRLLILAGFGLAFWGCRSSGVRGAAELGLDGMTAEAVVERYGRPAYDTTFVVRRGDRLMEFRNGLYPTVIDRLAEGDSAAVREIGWEGNPGRAVWATEQGGTWRVVSALEWSRDVQF